MYLFLEIVINKKQLLKHTNTILIRHKNKILLHNKIITSNTYINESNRKGF